MGSLLIVSDTKHVDGQIGLLIMRSVYAKHAVFQINFRRIDLKQMG